jgi:hypothetical protein
LSVGGYLLWWGRWGLGAGKQVLSDAKARGRIDRPATNRAEQAWFSQTSRGGVKYVGGDVPKWGKVWFGSWKAGIEWCTGRWRVGGHCHKLSHPGSVLRTSIGGTHWGGPPMVGEGVVRELGSRYRAACRAGADWSTPPQTEPPRLGFYKHLVGGRGNTLGWTSYGGGRWD